MRSLSRLLAPAIAALALTAPANAQLGQDIAYNVGFFERVAVGDVEITPIAILEDSRCRDYRLCFRRDALVVSALLWEFDRKTEVILSLDELTPVPGGALLLTSGGSTPVDYGA
ncbi:MAG: hypothetical protein AAFY56_23600, partial [Pseudomonadota bacterium]